MNSQETVFVDVRELEEFAAGHVDGAMNVPLSAIGREPKQLANVPRDAKLVVYCNSGNRSNTAIDILKKQGYGNLENGINQAEIEKNYP